MAWSNERYFWKLKPLSVKEGLERISLSHSSHCQFLRRKLSSPDDNRGIAQSMSIAVESIPALHIISNREVHSPHTSTVNPVPHRSFHPAFLACASADQRPLDPGHGQKRYSRNKSNTEQGFCHKLPNLQLPQLDVVINVLETLRVYFTNFSCLHLNIQTPQPVQLWPGVPHRTASICLFPAYLLLISPDSPYSSCERHSEQSLPSLFMPGALKKHPRA